MIDTILFDVDGVLLSEEGYFDASALTVWELLVSPSYLGFSIEGLPAYTPVPSEATVRKIRTVIFDEDRVLDFIKQCGINANWDMVYLQFSAQLLAVLKSGGDGVRERIVKDRLVPTAWRAQDLARLSAAFDAASGTSISRSIDFGSFVNWFGDCTSKENLFSKLSSGFAQYRTPAETSDERSLWEIARQAFQAWYLGDTHFDGPPSGKSGFLQAEVPLIDVNRLLQMLENFMKHGIRLGIATGRPQIETYVPLGELGWLSAFDLASITTASDVVEAEAQRPNARPLAKPHPFAYLRSYLQTTDVDAILGHPVPIARAHGENVLVVGDSVADWMAARRAGFRFAAVLTGLTGQAARTKFEELGCDWILDNVLELGRVELK